jgi:hypothetical protein
MDFLAVVPGIGAGSVPEWLAVPVIRSAAFPCSVFSVPDLIAKPPLVNIKVKVIYT